MLFENEKVEFKLQMLEGLYREVVAFYDTKSDL